jgi:putative effector of murein hydrolase
MTLGGTVVAGDTVRISSNLVYAQRDSETTGVVGVAMSGGAVTEVVAVNFQPHVIRVKAASAVSFALGDLCYCTGTAKTYDTGTTSDVAAGICVKATAAAAGYFDMLVLPIYTGNPPTHG